MEPSPPRPTRADRRRKPACLRCQNSLCIRLSNSVRLRRPNLTAHARTRKSTMIAPPCNKLLRGLFRAEVSGRQKYFRLNREYPLFREVRGVRWWTWRGSNSRPHDCQESGHFPYLPPISMFSMALHQFGASAFAQKKIPFSTNLIEFWNTFGTLGVLASKMARGRGPV